MTLFAGSMSIPSLQRLSSKRVLCGVGEFSKHSFSSRHHGLQSAVPFLVSRRSRQFSAMASKIELYSLATPNGMKTLIGVKDLSLVRLDLQVGIALEEMGLEYNPHIINISKNDQFTPEFIAINPNSKIPAITDPNGPDGKPINIFESGAILLYLAEKSGKFLSPDPRLKWETIQWVMFQMAGVGPMFGQFGHFYRFAKEKCDHPYPVERYSTEVKRLLGVLEKRLEGQEFLVGNEYSIADMATVPWVRGLETASGVAEFLGVSNFPNVLAWTARCLARPATAKGLTVCASK